jgi:hypothetical protein
VTPGPVRGREFGLDGVLHYFYHRRRATVDVHTQQPGRGLGPEPLTTAEGKPDQVLRDTTGPEWGVTAHLSFYVVGGCGSRHSTDVVA